MNNKITSFFMYGLPLWFFMLLFFLYGYGQTDLSMLNKIAGLLALMLLGTSFLIGPLSYFASPWFTPLRGFRKYLGISGVMVATLHFLLSFTVYYKMDAFFMFLDSNNPHIFAVYAGLFALLYFIFMSLTSTKSAIQTIGGRNWKILQTLGYIALALVMLHFILAETNNGAFVIRRLLGRVVFVYGFIVLLARVIVFALVHLRQKNQEF